MIVKKESAWKFVTSSTGGLGVEFIAAEGGVIYMTDPGGSAVSFKYGAAGVGITYGFKLPKIGKVDVKVLGKAIGAAVAPASFPNTGIMYVLDSFAGDELTRDDITGVCQFVEVGAAMFAGGSATAMLVGMSPVWLAGIAMGPASPFYFPCVEKLVSSATGVLLMAGINASLMAGVGAAAFLGGLI